MSVKEKELFLKIILLLIGVLAGWTTASYGYLYFTGNGVASDYATGYSIASGLIVFAILAVMAFKLRIVQK